MFLLVDGCPLQTPSRDRGIGRYTSALIGGLRAVRPDWRIQVVEHSRLPPIPPSLIHGLPVVRFDSPFPYDLGADANRLVNDRYYADWLLARRPDHVLFTSVFEWLGAMPKFVDGRLPTSAVMYDLIPILFPEQYNVLLPSDQWYARRLRDAARVDTLYAISECAAQDTRQLLGPGAPDVVNVQGAVDARFVPHPADQLEAVAAPVRAKYGLTKPFILYVGGSDYRKNLNGAVEGYAALPTTIRSRYQLVIACHVSDHQRDLTQQVADRLGVGGDIVITGFVSDAELIVLYQTCRTFFFPSLYEGLGLPVLEALYCGAPVVCSNISSMPEFAGDVSRLFNPYDPVSMADALVATFDEPPDQRRADRVAFAQSFTWEKTAEAVARGIEAPRPSPQPSRRRVAWVTSSLPSTRAEVADSAEFLAAAAQQCDVEMVLQTRMVPSWLTARHQVLTPDEVEDRHEAVPFDVFVFNVGPPGPDPLVRMIAARHRGLVVLNHPDPSEYQVDLTWPLLAGAAGIVVRSVAARRWVRSITDTPVVVVPDPPVGDLTGRLFAAAVADTVSRLDTSDARWFDAAANVLAAATAPVPSWVFDSWVALRHKARTPTLSNRNAA